jgi:hypothetical protein
VQTQRPPRNTREAHPRYAEVCVSGWKRKERALKQKARAREGLQTTNQSANRADAPRGRGRCLFWPFGRR